MVLNLIETLVCFTLFLWLVGLGFSYILQRQQAYWNWTTRTLRAFWRDNWRYIICFVLGYIAAREEVFRLVISQ